MIPLAYGIKGAQAGKRKPGIIDYTAREDPKEALLDTSIWKDRDSMGRFVMTEPHSTTMKRFEEWAGDGSTFVE